MLLFDGSKNHRGLLQFSITIFNCIFLTTCLEGEENYGSVNCTNASLISGSLEKQCQGKICLEGHFCDENFICRPTSGFENLKQRPSCAAKNGNCTVATCCPFLVCINKTCRKPESTIEFIALTKISLEITFAVILSAIFIFLLKNFLNSGCLKFNHFQQGEGSRETIHRHSRQPVAGRPVFDIRQDKPPSYEECVSSSSREFLVEPPPPYTISGNCRMEFNRNDASIILPNFNDQSMKTLKVSEFMELEKKINS